MTRYQYFINDIDEQQRRIVIVNWPQESEVIYYDDYVFETFVEDKYYLIKIKKELLIYDNVEILNIKLLKRETYWENRK